MAAEGTRQVAAGPDDAGTRLDQFLARACPDLSRSQIQRLIHDGLVVVEGRRPPVKPGHRVEGGDQITVSVPAPAPVAPAAEALPLTVLYDDADLVVIDKPAGMVVHPAVGHATGTLVNALLHHVNGLSGVGGSDRPGIVHRLDKGTSGVMVVAKHDAAHRALSRQFHDREVLKQYLALVWGTPKAGQTIERAIGRDPRHRTKMSTRGPHARPAITTIEAVEPLRGVSLVTVRIGTGRTHQIRVHLSESGHAVVGDDTYGGVKHHPLAHLRIVRRLTRPFLHAWTLAFTHPIDGRALRFTAPLPDDLTAVLTPLRESITHD